MARELNEDTGFTISIKTLGGIAAAIAAAIPPSVFILT